MTWMTPLDAWTSFTPFTYTLPSRTTMSRGSPFTVFGVAPLDLTMSAAMTLPLTTWYVRIDVSFSLSASSASIVPAGSFANAASVGAKTVNGPGPDRVSTRPAAFTAATSVLWSRELTAFWTMFRLGYMAA